MNAATTRYIVKCDDCKTELRGTDSLGEAAAGGRCEACRRPDTDPTHPGHPVTCLRRCCRQEG